MKVCVVLPCYNSGTMALDVISGIGPEVDYIVAVDDCCPHKTGKIIEEQCSDDRVSVIYNDVNLGVGGAMIAGYRYGKELGADILVKMDSDGQMDPSLIHKFIGPIISGYADYTKGNRFYNINDVSSMPLIRIIGNAALSFLCKLSSGYWNIFDPTNGYTAIHGDIIELVDLNKLERRFFFESDLLMRLNIARAVVWDIPMKARYGEEKSNLSIIDSGLTFGVKHIRNFFKRIFYSYFLRDFSLASLQLFSGIILMIFSIIFGVFTLSDSAISGIPSSPGDTMLFGVTFLSGLQFLLSFFSYDYQMIPSRPVHSAGDLTFSRHSP